MGIYLTISHACLPYLPSERTLFWSDLLVAGKVVSWEKWDSSEYGRWERWEGSELGRWERWEDGRLGKWKRWADSELRRWKRWQDSEMARSEVGG